MSSTAITQLHPAFVNVRSALVDRRINDAFLAMDELRKEPVATDAGLPGAGVFVGLLAQLVNLGYSTIGELETHLSRFTADRVELMQGFDIRHLTFARGVSAFMLSSFHKGAMLLGSTRSTDDAERAAEDRRDPILQTAATYYRARCLARIGEDADALRLCREASGIAATYGLRGMEAIIAIPQSWLTFHRDGDEGEARRLLKFAKETLGSADDRVSMAHGLMAEARINRRTGHEAAALHLLPDAIRRLRVPTPATSSLAKALLDLSITERLRALTMKTETQKVARRQSMAGALDLLLKPGAIARELRPEDPIHFGQVIGKRDVLQFFEIVRQTLRVQQARLPKGNAALIEIDRLRVAAGRHLDEAEELYNKIGSEGGRGTVALNQGFLALDRGALQEAENHAERALSAGVEAEDPSLKARARLLTAQVAFARAAEDGSNRVAHVAEAVRHAKEAVKEAELTQNDRIRGKAYTWLGLAAVAAGDLPEAQTCRDKARKYFNRSSRDYAMSDYVSLCRRLLNTAKAERVMHECIEQGVKGRTRDERTRHKDDPLLRSLMKRLEAALVIEVHRALGGNRTKTVKQLEMGPDLLNAILREDGAEPKARPARRRATRPQGPDEVSTSR